MVADTAANVYDVATAAIAAVGGVAAAAAAAWAGIKARKAAHNSEPVSNGAVPEIQKGINELRDSFVDLHRRIDSHLEDHVPKQRRRRLW